MEIKTIVTGELYENCYIISNNNKCIVIDPGDEFSKIDKEIKDEVVGVLVTHYHFDHIGALDEIKKKYNIEENKIPIDDFNIEVIKTPGHKSDCLTFYFKDFNLMFTGDFIFYNSIGRTDLETGSMSQMITSLKMMKNYPKDVIIYPGHGPKSVLGIELDKLGI